MSGDLIAALGVTRRYGEGEAAVHALSAVDLELRAGELAGLVGPSGSGKTTLLNVLFGWEQPDAGAILWRGEDLGLSGPGSLSWSEISVVPQSLGLLEELSIEENVTLPARLAQRASPATARHGADLVGRLGLASVARRPPSQTSLGEQQRAAVARALVLRPALILADEPSSHQDARWAEGTFAVLRAATEAGAACLVATHSQEGLDYVDRVLEMRDGRLATAS